MSEVIKFKQAGAVVNTSSRELSPLAKSMSSVMTSRRLQTNTNGTFKRIVNGEQVGDAVRGSVDVIIINALPKVSRIFYKNKYDPDAVATLPDCWSNLGDKPEAASANPQSSNCLDCNQNVKGSGGGDRDDVRPCGGGGPAEGQGRDGAPAAGAGPGRGFLGLGPGL